MEPSLSCFRVDGAGSSRALCPGGCCVAVLQGTLQPHLSYTPHLPLVLTSYFQSTPQLLAWLTRPSMTRPAHSHSPSPCTLPPRPCTVFGGPQISPLLMLLLCLEGPCLPSSPFSPSKLLPLKIPPSPRSLHITRSSTPGLFHTHIYLCLCLALAICLSVSHTAL